MWPLVCLLCFQGIQVNGRGGNGLQVNGAETQTCTLPFMRLQKAVDPTDKTTGALIVEVGRFFLKTPYVPATLDQSREEALVVRLDAMDCFTFMDQVLALSQTLASHGDEAQFRSILQQIRYRDGQIRDYTSRLHYTVDWAFENAKQQRLRDVTQEIGGSPYPKKISFMSQHPSAYPSLADPALLRAIAATEAQINQRTHHYLPETRLAQLETQIQEGDVLALTTTVPGLDVAHVGFATFQEGRLHLLHASSVTKQVEIMAEPLSDYLAGAEKRDGVMVFRPLPFPIPPR